MDNFDIKFVVLAVVVICTMAVPMAMERPLKLSATTTTLSARLRLDGESSGSSSCWESLYELQSCTGEVIVFFFNGETQLGHGCCRAIRIIEHQCWPQLLGSLGFTSQETDVLRGYCDAADSSGSVSLPPPFYVAPNTSVYGLTSSP